MNFFADLDDFTITISVLAIVGNLLCLGVIWRRYRDGNPIKLVRLFGIPLAITFFGLSQVRNAYCPDAYQLSLRVTGQIHAVRSYTYHSGKSDYQGSIVCVENCGNDATQLELSSRASRVLKSDRILNRLSVVYLQRVENAAIGNGQIMVVHPVVEIDDPSTGEKVYWRDLHRHWPRVIVLLSDAVFGVICFVLYMRWSADSHDSDKLDKAPKEVVS